MSWSQGSAALLTWRRIRIFVGMRRMPTRSGAIGAAFMGSRWADWSPVGFDTDPAPGDQDMVEALVVHLRTWSGRLERQSVVARQVLDTNLGASSWSGLAADVFSARLRALEAAAAQAAARHTEGVEAATRWSSSMMFAQGDADRALRDAEEALADLEAAEASVAALGAEQAALSAALRALEKAYNSREKPAPGSSAPGHGEVTSARLREQDASDKLASARFTVEDAQERLDDAKRRAERARREYSEAEKTFADALDAALHGALAPVQQPELQAFASVVGKLSHISVSASVNASLMATLQRLTPEELAALEASNPKLVQQFWEHPPSAGQVAKWWSSLGDEAKDAFETAAPGVLGNLAGLPYGVRDRCNRAVYEVALLRAISLTPEQRKVLVALEKILADPSASLVSLNLDATVPMVAVGYGDLDTADTVTWAAPGMNSDAADATEGWSRAARNLNREQRHLDGARSHAVVGWLGYDTPDLVSVSTPASAQDGSWRFANELDGTHATRSASASASFPCVSVVAHSYGTTMAADALTRVTHAVDSFTMLGSAGIDTQVVTSLSDLRVKQAGEQPAIYTTSAQLDFLAPFGSAVGGRAEPNPEALANPGTLFAMPVTGLTMPKSMSGAQSFSSEGTVLPSGEVLKQTKGHGVLGENTDGPNALNGIAPEGSGYFDKGTEALRNASYTTIGLPDNVAGGLRSTR
ncbi:alpha/beta hydrolase [Leifsonia sp. NPDC102414]|uniref:alpha/beta hydrolase n=1 Tax=Leifsonia sp. NPDC102414 TaxID=3364124 RepID=UPI0038049C6E